MGDYSRGQRLEDCQPPRVAKADSKVGGAADVGAWPRGREAAGLAGRKWCGEGSTSRGRWTWRRWLYEHGIEPHVTVFDKSFRTSLIAYGCEAQAFELRHICEDCDLAEITRAATFPSVENRFYIF